MERALETLRPGMVFPLPLDGEHGAWTVVQTLSEVSRNPMIPGGGAPCRAYAAVLRQVGNEDHALGAVAVFCQGKQVAFESAADHWVIRANPFHDHVDLKLFFSDALVPGQDVLQVRETTEGDEAITIMEYAFAAEGTRLKKILQAVGSDPASYAVNVGNTFIRKQTDLIRQKYSSGFVGASQPKDFVYGHPHLLPDGTTVMEGELRAQWSPSESSFVHKIPTLSDAQRAQIQDAADKQIEEMRKGGQLDVLRQEMEKRINEARARAKQQDEKK